MGLFALAIAFILFAKRIKSSGEVKFLAIGGFFCYIMFALILNAYSEVMLGWEYGVPGADMAAHLDGAIAISNGTSIFDLYQVSSRFQLQFSNIGYILYAYFLAIVSFMPVIFSIRFSLFIFYTIQCMVAIVACLNIVEFVSSERIKQKKIVFIMLISCIAIPQMAAVLMRDIWVLFFISLLMEKINQEERKNRIQCIAIILLVAILRSYSLVITVPLYIFYGLKDKKIGIISSAVIAAIFFVGAGIINQLAAWMNILWQYDFNFQIVDILSFFFFPNIISQTHNVQHLTSGYHAVHGGNNEWIYYLLAIWNCFTMPIVTLGIIKIIKKENFLNILFWTFNLINIGLIYAVFYDSISEPRHKLMILCAYAYLFALGNDKLHVKYRGGFLLFMSIVLLLLFAFIS